MQYTVWFNMGIVDMMFYKSQQKNAYTSQGFYAMCFAIFYRSNNTSLSPDALTLKIPFLRVAMETMREIL